MRNVKERKIRVFMGFTVMERPGESGEKDVGGGAESRILSGLCYL